MTLYTDVKFLHALAPRLDKFTQKSEYLWNFRCCFCGDSHKNKVKARGYIFRRSDSLFFMCHNCSASMSIQSFIKALDRSLYDEYRLETFGEKGQRNLKEEPPMVTSVPPVFKDKSQIKLPTVASLEEGHYAKNVLRKRQIPTKFWNDLYFAYNFEAFVEEIAPSEHSDTIMSDARIVIPFYSMDKKLLGFQGRALDVTCKTRYITIKLSEANEKIFGLDRLDVSKTIYVLEGPFDSMFVENSIAMMDPQLYRAALALGHDLDYVFVYDNEKRNKAICANMAKTISMGKKICIWPKDLEEKDVNDMILSGKSISEIRYIIDTHTYDGLQAQLEFNTWKLV